MFTNSKIHLKKFSKKQKTWKNERYILRKEKKSKGITTLAISSVANIIIQQQKYKKNNQETKKKQNHKKPLL